MEEECTGPITRSRSKTKNEWQIVPFDHLSGRSRKRGDVENDDESEMTDGDEDVDIEPPKSKKIRHEYTINATIQNTKGNDNMNVVKIPNSYKEAMNSDQWRDWKIAMDKEMKALEEHKVLRKIQRLPEGKRAIGTRWVFVTKPDESESGIKFKARLVAKGFTQKQDIDYHNTYSPVARLSSFRLLLAISIQRDLVLWQADVNNAYLNAELKIKQYIKPIEGYYEGGYLLLEKALYGLKQSGLEWNEEFNKWIIEQGFLRCRTEPCLYIYNNVGIVAYLLIYVDDIICSTNDISFKETLFERLNTKYGIKDLGKLSRYLGIEVIQGNGSIKIHQEKYCNNLLRRFNYTDKSNPCNIPMETTARFSINDGDRDTNFPYREAIGGLMYLVTATRPDLSYAVGMLSRFVERPTSKHVGAVKKILRFLIGTKHRGITYTKEADANVDTYIHAYSDSDWGNDLDTRYSTTGFVLTLCGGAISWASRRQTIVAQSTAEAEYIAACEASMEGKAILNILQDMKSDIKQLIPLAVDNQSSLVMANSPTFSRKTRHIELKWHYIRERIEKGDIQMVKICSEVNPADLFTKPLAKQRFNMLSNKIGDIRLITILVPKCK